MTQTNVVTLSNLSYTYGAGALSRRVLDCVSLTLHSGEIVILSGPSGSGKTTLLTLIGALRQVESGSLTVLGHDLAKAKAGEKRATRQKIGFVFQQHNLLKSLTARQNVEMTLEMLDMTDPGKRKNLALQALADVNIRDYADRYPHQMSVGQKQRVAIARATVHQPSLILADEPTASLDKTSGDLVIQHFSHLAKEKNKTVFIVTHDSRIFKYADRVIEIDDGKIRQ